MKLARTILALAALLCLAASSGCMTPEQHEAAMAEARRLRGQTAYDGHPAFGEPYGEWGREKLSSKWAN